jgi:1-deoxy-D-xylulose-5-phosphate reductoisomerase
LTKNIAILGSTGSIGRQALQVIESLGRGYRVVALTAGSNSKLLEEQVRRFKPGLAVLSDTRSAAALKKNLRDERCRVLAGPEGQVAAAVMPEADLVLVALVGFSGFEPTLAALEAGKQVALANKEALVVGGELLQARGLLTPGRILPVDSEHSAIWQCLGSAPHREVRRILLTASGGPFWDWDPEMLENATPEQALAHPNWNMGAKITVDSSTMMNKGFEVLEAHWLFDLPLEKIEVIIHPQSVVHSMVEFIDGSVLAQIGAPDMRLPIQYALTYPERRENSWPKTDFFIHSWSFEPPDRQRFPCLDLAYRAGEMGGTAPACLNAANEVAVERFLRGQLKFTGIAAVIKAVLLEHRPINQPQRSDLIDADRWARRRAAKLIDIMTGAVN